MDPYGEAWCSGALPLRGLVVCSVSSFSHSLEVHMKAHSTELGVGAGEGGCIQNRF